MAPLCSGGRAQAKERKMNDDWHALGHILVWRDWRVFVRATGQGTPLLLIHGFPTSSLDWHRITPELAKHHRVLCFDLLGFGWSDKPTGHDYRIAEQADLAEAVLAHFGVEEAAVLAHDYGDTVAQELLARQQGGHRGWRMTRLGLLPHAVA
jgi:pimeloyl-ACP methyl ester carboxylesterase